MWICLSQTISLCKKSKDFYLLKKKKQGNTYQHGRTIIHSISGWVTLYIKDLNVKMPDSFDKLESFRDGCMRGCFHYLDIDCSNAEKNAITFQCTFLPRKK